MLSVCRLGCAVSPLLLRGELARLLAALALSAATERKLGSGGRPDEGCWLRIVATVVAPAAPLSAAKLPSLVEGSSPPSALDSRRPGSCRGRAGRAAVGAVAIVAGALLPPTRSTASLRCHKEDSMTSQRATGRRAQAARLISRPVARSAPNARFIRCLTHAVNAWRIESSGRRRQGRREQLDFKRDLGFRGTRTRPCWVLTTLWNATVRRLRRWELQRNGRRT